MLAALTLAATVIAPTHLKLEAWTGADVPTASSTAERYRLRVDGVPNARLVLRVDGLAPGWIAAFCTANYCSPMRVDVTLSAQGRAVYQFELIREDSSADAHTNARVVSDDGASIFIKR